ncbi:MAG: zinc metallopeptidase [Flavobacteriales bacterium AspAUS03]
MTSPYYLIIGITFFISWLVSNTLKSKFHKYAQLFLQNGMSGKEVAEKMLRYNGIYDVKVVSVEGQLTDHYNPLNKTVNLSQEVYSQKNATAAAVAAHECGHAVQHQVGYNMLKLRSQLVPVVNISSIFTNIAIMTGLAVFYSSGGENTFILQFGISLFAMAVLFSLITLPVEFDASRRALAWLKNDNIVTSQEYCNAKDALQWAAMTYIVAALGALAQLLYFISLLNNRRN